MNTHQIEDTFGTIVVVDDNPNNLKVLRDMLQQAGFKVRASLDGATALRSINLVPPDLILLDIRMPGMDGYEVCRELKANPNTADIPVIFISALLENKDKIMAFRVGGMDYITKPFHIEEVLARVQTHIQLYRMQRHLQQMVNEQTQELNATYQSLRRSEQQYSNILFQTIETIALTLEKRDPYTAGHQQRVAVLCENIARMLNLDEVRVVGLKLGASIHDIGKIYVPYELLNRPGVLTELEMSLIKTHPTVGYDIVKDIDFPWPVAQLIIQHHERIDGSGYPHGLKGDELLLESKILAVADVLEAMSSHRPYRPSLGAERAIEEIKRGSGTKYDPQVVEACLKLLDEGWELLGG